jgi:putative endonuclease
MARHNETGILGEKLAKGWALEKGYTIITQNWRHGHWEIDLIAMKDEKLQFFEIKTKRSLHFGHPEVMVDKKKMHYFISAGTEYLRLNPQHKWIRFNILSIMLHNDKPTEYFLLEDVYY